MLKLYIFILTFITITFGGLLRPTTGDNLNYIHIVFEWEQISNAVSYNLQVSNASTFNQTILDINESTTLYILKNNINWNNSYYWRVRPVYNSGDFGEWMESEFSVDGKKFPEIEADIYDENLIQEGLVAFGGFAPDLASAVIDKYGNEIWNTGLVEFTGEQSEGFIINHINEYGNIYGLSGYEHPNNTGTKINYDNNLLWSAPTTEPAYAVDIHEFKQIPNGNYMGFVPDYQLGPIAQGNWTFIYQAIGYLADGVTEEYPWIGMRLVEWDEDGNEVWNWNPFEHFTMDDHDLYGGIWWDFDTGSHDWMHSNAFHFDDEENVIYVSHRHLSRISKISYPSGVVIWNIGMPEQYNTGSDNICTDLGNSFQHNIQLLDDGSLLFFDNGNLSQMLMGDQNPTSRIRRIRVYDNNYCETEWEYELPPNLFGLGMGSVQLLDNGNYLIYTFGSGLNQVEPTLQEVTQNHDVVWNYQGIPNAAWYRTYKIPSLHPEVFSVIANNYYTDELANEIIEISNNSLGFILYNKSDYTQQYKFIFSDLTDGGNPMFDYHEGELTLGPNENIDMSFLVANQNISSSTIGLSIWPEYHTYALKELIFSVEIENSIVGDLNNDEIVNVLDVVVLVNMIINNNSNPNHADLNNDDTINVIDVVILINIILGN